VGLLSFFSQARYHLGAALATLGETDGALRSLQIAVAHGPNLFAVHRKLAEIYEARGDLPRQLKHQRLADGFPPLDEIAR
jgi:Tfp pilus assembly protein PilF